MNLEKLIAVFDAAGVCYEKVADNEIMVDMPMSAIKQENVLDIPPTQSKLNQIEGFNYVDDLVWVSIMEDETGFLNWLVIQPYCDNEEG